MPVTIHYKFVYNTIPERAEGGRFAVCIQSLPLVEAEQHMWPKGRVFPLILHSECESPAERKFQFYIQTFEWNAFYHSICEVRVK